MLTCVGSGACDAGSGNLNSDKEYSVDGSSHKDCDPSVARCFSVCAQPLFFAVGLISPWDALRGTLCASLVARTMLPVRELLSGARLTCSALEGFAAVPRGAHLFSFCGLRGFRGVDVAKFWDINHLKGIHSSKDRFCIGSIFHADLVEVDARNELGIQISRFCSVSDWFEVGLKTQRD